MRKITLILLSLIFLASCSNSNKKPVAEKSVIAQPDTPKEKSNVSNTMAGHPGEKVYNAVCLACHMRNGTGVPGMHPPITKSEFVNGDPEKLIQIVLKGLKGKVEVQGNVYDNVMPPQANLTDQQIADVLTFVRGSFGNSSGAITTDQVAKARASK